MQNYTVRTGDTLWSIALRLLGAGERWTELWALNRPAIENAAKDSRYRGPDWIYPGTVLLVPRCGM